MLYNLLALKDQFGLGINILRYLTFRTGGAILTSLIICFIIGGPLIKFLKKRQGKGQPIRSDGPESHLITKVGTPTMGGLLILIALIVSVL
ncbi:MAG: phospho-N-acetylmuramoyl-pentapeptide-transferase, partial [Alphaproteobacteria bacterium]|nr:phospho-N-acetylmuramoyl-pentapeptide-transferase [Alphaproteobacteria bacterium]